MSFTKDLAYVSVKPSGDSLESPSLKESGYGGSIPLTGTRAMVLTPFTKKY